MNEKCKRLTAAAIVFMLILNQTFATIWLVDNQSTVADDQNPGTSWIAPLETIGEAINRLNLNGGDKIFIKPGVYYENPIVISGINVTNGNTIIRGYPDTDPTKIIIKPKSIGIGTGLKIVNCKNLYFYYMTVTDWSQGVQIYESFNVKFISVNICNIDYYAAAIQHLSDTILFENCKIYNTGRYSETHNAEGFYIGKSSYTGTSDPFYPDNTKNITIRGCEIFNTRAEAINVKGEAMNVTVESCYIHDLDIYNGAAIHLEQGPEINCSSHKFFA
ncbi:MAG TPA: hypothetical protein DC049_13195, partial [Spirochaetia bacterium]|nr:hypothetical protein [Spirochaetia bacterium]